MYKKLLNLNGGLLIPMGVVLCDHIQKLETQSDRMPDAFMYIVLCCHCHFCSRKFCPLKHNNRIKDPKNWLKISVKQSSYFFSMGNGCSLLDFSPKITLPQVQVGQV